MKKLSSNAHPRVFKWPSDKKLIVYHTNWSTYARNFQVKDLPIDYISDINYAFFDLRQNTNGFYVPTSGDPWADTDCRFTDPEKGLQPLDSWDSNEKYFGNFGQFKKLKDSGKKFNLGLSVGGWTWSVHFSNAVKDEASRAAFTDEIIRLFKLYPIFNRIDLDWEYISPEGMSYGLPGNVSGKDDPRNFSLFLRMMREKLDLNGMSHYEISMCTSADPQKLGILPIASMVEYLDTVNIMTYDFADGAWGLAKATHQTNIYPTDLTLFSVDAAVKAFIKLGVPADKLVIGAAYYSRGFSGTSGLGEVSTSGSPDMTWEKGIADYKDLPMPGATEMYDVEAKAAYSYDPVKKIFNSYDNPRSIKDKCQYVIDNGLKGIIVWEASGDSTESSRCLSKVIYDNLSSVPVVPVVPVEVPAVVPVVPVEVVVVPVEVVVVPVVAPVVPVAPVEVPVVAPVVAPVVVIEAPGVKKWMPFTKYSVPDEVTYIGEIYTCRSQHISQITWTPDVTLALWEPKGPVLAPPLIPLPAVPGSGRKIKKICIHGSIDSIDYEYYLD